MIDEPWEGAEEEPPAAGRPAHRRRRQGRRGAEPAGPEAVPREPRRLAAVALVAVSLVAAGFASRSVHLPPAAKVAPPAAAGNGGMPVVVGHAASSAAWYCPGPLPYGAGNHSSIVLTSSADRSVAGRVTISTGRSTAAVPVTVPAGASLRLPVSGAGAAGWAAATVVLDGGGVGVWQEVAGPGGSSTQSCQVTTSAAWSLPAGSTAHNADLLVSLFNPTATSAVASLTFSASFGVATGAAVSAAGSATPPAPVAPAVFQGVIVGPGQLAVLDVGKQVQLRPELATTVTVTTGRLVAGEWSTASMLGHPQDALVEAVPAARSQWWFPLAGGAAGGSVTTGYWLSDPGREPAKVTILQSLAAGSTVSTTLTVPAASLVVVSPPPAAVPPAKGRHGPPVLGWALVQVSGAAGVVAAQGTFPVSGPHASVGSEGFPQVSLGAPAPAASWIVPGPATATPPAKAAAGKGRSGKGRSGKGQPAPSGGTLFVAGPEASQTGSSRTTATVSVFLLGSAGQSGTAPAPVRLVTVPVANGTVRTVGLPAGAGTTAAGGLLVVANAPVVVGVSYAEVSGAALLPNGLPSTGTAVA